MIPDDPAKWAVTTFRNSDQDMRYLTYRNYINGIHPLSFATEKFRSAFGRQFREFAYNRCGSVVRAHADRLQIEGFAADSDAIAQAAQDLWDANEMDVREGHVSSEAFGIGDAYVIVTPHPDTGEILISPQEAPYVRVHYDQDRPGVVDLAAKFWIDENLGNRGRLNLYFRDRIEKYITGTKVTVMPMTPKAFDPYRPEGEPWPMPLNLDDTVPVFHFANDARTNSYGISELQAVIPLQDAANLTLMDEMVAMEFAAFKQKMLLNVAVDDEGQVDLERFVMGINRIGLVTGEPGGPPPSIAEFSAADITQWELVAESWDKRISRVSAVPVHHLTMEGGFDSGRALRIAEGPFITKIEDRQRAFGNVWSRVMEYAVRLNGQAVEPGSLRVNWKSAAPLSEEDQLDIALLRDALGFPFEANLKHLGYEPDQIAEIVAEKDAAVQTAQRAFDGGRVPTGFDDDEEAVA